MTIKSPVLDYVLADTMELTYPGRVRTVGHSLRTTLLGLLPERAATVDEMAIVIGRPESPVADHVSVLETAA